MPIVCVGLSHHTAPLEVRERHAFPAARMGEALVALCDYPSIAEAAMLGTCGRLEIYAEVADFESGAAQIKAFLKNFRHSASGYDLESYLYTRLGQAAVEHLFRVATGLDSMLIGEAEILGQVKEAYVQAHAANALGKRLHHLFREALRAGKAARTQTRIGGESVSVATAAIDTARARLGTLAGANVVIVGAGTMGRTAAKRLRLEGAVRLVVTNRSIAKAREIVAQTGFGEAVELPSLADAVAHADVVLTATGASDFLLDVDLVAAAMAQRPQRPLFVLDIAVPRDADPAIAQIENVFLTDVDGLKSIVDERLELRREAIPAVEEIVGEYVERFAHWYRARVAVPVIATLTQKAETIRSAELDRLFARCPEMTQRERMLVTGMSMTIVSKLLHSVILKVREKATQDHEEALSQARVLDELFELNLTEHIAELLAQPAIADG